MHKPDYPPLLLPGIHTLTMEQIKELAVTPFLGDARRALLFASFQQWVQKLQFYQVRAILWINGSFVTSKFAPNDIDCIMWSPTTGGTLTEDQWREVRALTNREMARKKFNLDFYIENPAPTEKLHRQAYFRGMFGFQHDEKTPKGFVELLI